MSGDSIKNLAELPLEREPKHAAARGEGLLLDTFQRHLTAAGEDKSCGHRGWEMMSKLQVVPDAAVSAQDPLETVWRIYVQKGSWQESTRSPHKENKAAQSNLTLSLD